MTDAPHISNGRYKIIHPETGEPERVTRATNLADVLDNKYHLEQWERRTIVQGLTKRRDLWDWARATAPTDIKTWAIILAKAKEAGGAERGANSGTAFHSWTERYDRQEPGLTDMMTRKEKERIQLYADTLKTEGITIDRNYIERTVYNSTVNVCGTLDRLGEHAGYRKVIDVKTQKSMDFGHVSIAIQLATYAYADYIWTMNRKSPPSEEWLPMPEVSREQALVVHMPSATKTCDVYTVDLVKGWHYALVARDVYNSRAEKGLLEKVAEGKLAPRDWISEFLACTDVLSLNALGRECADSGEMTDDLKKLALGHRAALELEDK